MMKILKKMGAAVLTVIVFFIVTCVLSAVAAGVLGFNAGSGSFVGTAFVSLVVFVLLQPKMNAQGDWPLWKRTMFFAWLFMAMCGVKMLFVVF